MSDFLSTRQRRRVQADESSPSEVIDFGVDEEEKKKTAPPKAAFSSPFSFAPSQLWTSAQGALSSASSLLPSIDVLSPPSIDQISNRLPVKPPPPTNTFHASASSPFLSSIQQVDTSPPAPVEMPCRDRTGEFRTTAKSYQMRVQANGHVPEKNKQQAVNESIHFNQLAKYKSNLDSHHILRRIGRDLSQTCAKMEKLTELAKRKSLFEERNEIEQLSRVIKEDITGLNRQIATLQEYSRARTGGGRSTKQDHNQHSQLVVVGLQSKLANVSKDFQSVLQIRTENMKHERTRREKFSNADPVPFSIPSSSSTPNVRSALLADEPSSSVALDMGELERHQTQSLLMRGDDYVQARASTMETIEGSIHELGQIFTQLASLVSEQGEMVARIDSNVDTTALNIDAAHTELVRYFHSISKNRWLMLKVFGVVLIFSIIFIMFLT